MPTKPTPSAGEAVPAQQTVIIDPAVALHETRLLMQAIDAHYNNRNLLLAQQAHDLRAELEEARAHLAAADAEAEGQES